MPVSSSDEDRWMVVKHIAAFFGVEDRTVRNWGKQGKLPLRELSDDLPGMRGMLRSELIAWTKRSLA